MSSSKPERSAQPRSALALSRYLRAGVRSTHEAAAFLERHGAPREEAGRLIRASLQRGVLDDAACARLWAEQWARQGYAASAIRLRLAAKGLPTLAIDEATRECADPAEEEQRARRVAAQPSRRGADRRTGARLARTLASRGFDNDVIERVLGEPFER